MKTLSLYLAHPITGLTPPEVFKWYDEKTKALKLLGYIVYDPVTMQELMRFNNDSKEKIAPVGDKHPVSTSHAIFERDKWAATKVDIVLLDLTGAKHVSIGCCMELAWASLAGVHTVVVMEADNPHHHAFVMEAADVIFKVPQDAIDYLGRMIQ